MVEIVSKRKKSPGKVATLDNPHLFSTQNSNTSSRLVLDTDAKNLGVLSTYLSMALGWHLLMHMATAMLATISTTPYEL